MATHERHDAGATHVGAEPTASAVEGEPDGARRWPRYLAALALTAACTALAQLMFPWFEPTNTVPMIQLTLYEKQVVGSIFGSANPRRDIPRLLELYANGHVDLDGMITKRMHIDDQCDFAVAENR